jgi:hypothetical protein
MQGQKFLTQVPLNASLQDALVIFIKRLRNRKIGFCLYISVKLSRTAKRHRLSPAHLMSRFVCAGLVDICLSILNPHCFTRPIPSAYHARGGCGGTSTHPSTPNTTVNVMRPKRPSCTPPLANANRPARLFISYTA